MTLSKRPKKEKNGTPLPIFYFVYWIGGSIASAVHGVPRSTQGVDFVAELKEEQVDDLVVALESEFYIAFDDAGVTPTSAM